MSTQSCRHRWVDQVLTFWFMELRTEDWFRVNSSVDEAVSARFQDLHIELMDTPIDECLRSSDAALASVIVLDQFPRNIFRNSARAFASDPQARRLASEAIARGMDREIRVERRIFLYLPFEHSEELSDQDRAVELVTSLGNEVQLNYALAHRKIIDAFGRFPHRNGVMGRTSTDAELAYLAKPDAGF